MHACQTTPYRCKKNLCILEPPSQWCTCLSIPWTNKYLYLHIRMVCLLRCIVATIQMFSNIFYGTFFHQHLQIRTFLMFVIHMRFLQHIQSSSYHVHMILFNAIWGVWYIQIPLKLINMQPWILKSFLGSFQGIICSLWYLLWILSYTCVSLLNAQRYISSTIRRCSLSYIKFI